MFLSAGLVAESLGHDRIADLGGAARAMPVTFLALGLGGLSLMGLPPSGGFAAKWLLMKASIEAGQWVWAVVMAGGGLLAGGYLYRVLAPRFRARARTEKGARAQPRERRAGAGSCGASARLRAAIVLRLPADRPTGRGPRAAMTGLAATVWSRPAGRDAGRAARCSGPFPRARSARVGAGDHAARRAPRARSRDPRDRRRAVRRRVASFAREPLARSAGRPAAPRGGARLAHRQHRFALRRTGRAGRTPTASRSPGCSRWPAASACSSPPTF